MQINVSSKITLVVMHVNKFNTIFIKSVFEFLLWMIIIPMNLIIKTTEIQLRLKEV